MPAGLDVTNGVASYVGANEDAWHRLGTTIKNVKGLTAVQAMEEGHLGGWNVRKVPLLADTPKGKLVVPGRVAVIRDNPIVKGQIDVMGEVGKDFGIVQNEDHADLLNALVDESGAGFDTAGALGENGSRVFITMKLPGHIRVGGADHHNAYIAALNAHDGSMSFTFLVTLIRVVCGNTWNMAMNNHSASFRVRHTSGATQGIIVAAREALDVTFNYIGEFQEEAEKLVQQSLNQSKFEEIIAREFGAPEDAPAAVVTRATKRLDKMSELFAEARTQDGIRDTAWAGLMALTEWNDHFSPARGIDPEASRARRAIIDPTFKNKALKVMMMAATS